MHAYVLTLSLPGDDSSTDAELNIISSRVVSSMRRTAAAQVFTCVIYTSMHVASSQGNNTEDSLSALGRAALS